MTAGERKPERLLSGHDSGEIARAAKVARETESTWRVYRKEWLFEVRISDRERAEAWAEDRYAGRLLPEDLRVQEDETGWVVEARRWNVVGEWKGLERAKQHAATLSGEVQIVARNSRSEHTLRQYGLLRLVS